MPPSARYSVKVPALAGASFDVIESRMGGTVAGVPRDPLSPESTDQAEVEQAVKQTIEVPRRLAVHLRIAMVVSR
jgi:hypothetical protein